ncbi:condensation domain-containing protein [Rhodococcoides yunnanense]|uniref:condensation domain-containing protein n=1 Tax=Rhodococcoides yunnanense TaxID=278209 RepID=UPI0009341ACF|nr:condensation domain-containing protein [Rhodococcus yunnanensis]
MRVTTITEYVGAPGTYLEWPVSIGQGSPSDVTPSFNQAFHLSAALNDAEATSVWIAVAFDVSGPIDVEALSWAFTRFVERHPALRTSFHVDEAELRRRIHSPDDVSLGLPDRRTITDSSDLNAHMRARMDHLCHPSRSPSYSFAAVDRPNGSTVICGFDHAHVDAVSMTVVADEVAALYDARRSGRTVELTPGGSFVEYCAEEADTPTVLQSDPRVSAWGDFVERCGGTTPAFPHDLGVVVGEHAAQASTVHTLSTAAQTEQFESRCRALGGGMFSGIAAAMAVASTGMGGPTRLPFLLPLHTRHDPQWARAIGWFTTNAPMTVTVGDNFADTLLSAHTSFREALSLGTVPIPRVLGALGESFRRTRDDVFMISYIDYRGVPGAEPTRNPHHISNVTTADDAQFWISRTVDGLSLRSRFPDTVPGHAVVERFVRAFTDVISDVVDSAVDSDERSLVGPRA